MTKKIEAYGNKFITTGTRVNSSGETEVKATAGVLEQIVVFDNGADCTLTVANGNSVLGIAPLTGDLPRVIDCGIDCDDSIKVTLSGNDPAINWYKLDSTSGSTGTDSGSEANADLTLHNMEAGDWVDGKLGQCLNFGGVDEYAATAAPVIATSSLPFTICFWVNITDPSTTCHFFNQGGYFKIWQQTNDYLFFYTGRTSSAHVHIYHVDLVNDIFTANTWHHLAISGDGTQLAAGYSVYLDGNKVNMAVQKDAFNGTKTYDVFNIGASSLVGKMDDVRVYGSVITEEAIEHIYNSGSGRSDDYSMADVLVVYE